MTDEAATTETELDRTETLRRRLYALPRRIARVSRAWHVVMEAFGGLFEAAIEYGVTEPLDPLERAVERLETTLAHLEPKAEQTRLANQLADYRERAESVANMLRVLRFSVDCRIADRAEIETVIRLWSKDLEECQAVLEGRKKFVSGGERS